MINFIFMLTHSDATVPNALEVLGELRDSGLEYVGFKDVGASAEQLGKITDAAHEQGLEVMLEVVSTSAEEERRSLKAALEIGVDWVLGGTNTETGVEILAGADLRYCPFPGTVVGHPSVLEAKIAAIAADAARLTATPGVDGVDLLAYRHATANVQALVEAVVAASQGPVIAARSVVDFEQIALLAPAGVWGFTIGSAIFENRLPGGPGVPCQVRAVLDASATVAG